MRYPIHYVKFEMKIQKFKIENFSVLVLDCTSTSFVIHKEILIILTVDVVGLKNCS